MTETVTAWELVGMDEWFIPHAPGEEGSVRGTFIEEVEVRGEDHANEQDYFLEEGKGRFFKKKECGFVNTNAVPGVIERDMVVK